MKYLLGLLIMVLGNLSFAQQACTCKYLTKDYDPKKGYYYDKKTFDPLPTISYKMECIYTCYDKSLNPWKVSYVHRESHHAYKGGGPSQAKKFLCELSVKSFKPYYDIPDHVAYYDAIPLESFSSSWMNHRGPFKEWNDQAQCQ